MGIVSLSVYDLIFGSCLVLGLALLSLLLQLRLGKQIAVAGLRTAVQLTLLGLLLNWVFAHVSVWWWCGMGLVMLLAASREVMQRQQIRFIGWWGFGIGTVSMFLSSFLLTLLALQAIIDVDPWYQPQYSIPLLGMLLGNTMSGIALGIDRLTQSAWQQREVIEARLLLGQTSGEAVSDIRRESIRTGLIPIVNAMAVAGIVSLPGMMTGQILAGAPPVEAVKYQILIMFLISTGTGLGTLSAVWVGAWRLFDERQRLRLDRVRQV